MARILLLVVFVGVAATLFHRVLSFDQAAVSEDIEATLKCYDNPGLTVSVVRDGKILLARGYGVIDQLKDTPVTNATLFGIASLSKSFAATLLVKLLYKKANLTVDSRIQELLGDEFQMNDKFRSHETTFADLMAHRTAVPPNNFIRFDHNLTRETLLQRLHLLPSPGQFRVKYYYSNLIYGLVTRLAEIIGEKRWEDLVTEHLFHPLGMNSSTFASIVDFDRDDVAVGYQRINGTYSRVNAEFSRRWSELAGSGSVMSNAEDMAKWINFHLSGGQNMQGEQVVSPELLAEVHKPRFLVPTPSERDIRIPLFPVAASGNIYAHGFVRGFYRGYEHLAHSGSTQGYRAYISLLPEQKVGVFVALTGDDNSIVYRSSLVMYLMDQALGLEPWLNVSTICSYPEPWKPKAKPSNSSSSETTKSSVHDLQQYKGTYYNKAFGYLQVDYNDTVLDLVLTYGFGRWQLLQLTSQTNDSTVKKFYGKAMGATQLNINFISFLTKTQGQTIIVSVKVTSFEPETPPIFDKINAANSASLCHLAYMLLMVVLLILCL